MPLISGLASFGVWVMQVTHMSGTNAKLFNIVIFSFMDSAYCFYRLRWFQVPYSI